MLHGKFIIITFFLVVQCLVHIHLVTYTFVANITDGLPRHNFNQQMLDERFPVSMNRHTKQNLKYRLPDFEL